MDCPHSVIDCLSIQTLPKLQSILSSETSLSEDSAFFHLTINSLLTCSGNENLLLNHKELQGSASVDANEVVERLEVLEAKMEGLKTELRLEIESLDARQVDETKPLLEQIAKYIEPLKVSLVKMKADEAILRDNFDMVSHKTATYKKTHNTAKELFVDKADEIEENLEKYRDIRARAFQDLEKSLLERNNLMAQIDCLETVVKCLETPYHNRDYNLIMTLITSETFINDIVGTKNAAIVLARMKLLLFYRETQEVDMKYQEEAEFCLKRIKSKITDLVCFYWR